MRESRNMKESAKRVETKIKNVDLVEKVKRLAAEFEREIATPDEARQILELKGLDAVNF